MAEMGLGYGSEYQLLRYLGHHRNELNKNIQENTRLKGELVWLDFPSDINRLSLDREWKGIDFLPQQQQENLKSKWEKYWTGNTQHWDGIILHRSEGKEEWIIVEAKAHLKEIRSDCGAKENSKNEAKIKNAFAQTQKEFSINMNNNWLKNYYQLANRLAFINFLLDNGINASLLNIYFINGYEKYKLKDRAKVTIENKSVENEEEWKKVMNEEYDYLGINEKVKQLISNIFIDCKK